MESLSKLKKTGGEINRLIHLLFQQNFYLGFVHLGRVEALRKPHQYQAKKDAEANQALTANAIAPR